MFNENSHKGKIFFTQGGLGNQLFIIFQAIYFTLSTKQRVTICNKFLHSSTEPRNDMIKSILNLDCVNNLYYCECLSKRKVSSMGKFVRKMEYHFLLFLSQFPNGAVINFGSWTPSIEEIDKGPKRVFGYFQNALSAQHVIHEVLGIFQASFIQDINNELRESSLLVNEITESTKKKKFGIHIRGGDYLEDLNKGFGLLNHEYYSEIFRDHISIYLPKCDLKIFTNDLKYSKLILDKSGIPSETYEIVVDDEISTFKQMISRDFLVISNSSFSWWAAFICTSLGYDCVVLAPRPWFKDLYTSEANFYHVDWDFKIALWY